MRCLDEDCTSLLIDNVGKLTKWLETDRVTDPELLYWVPKYILMRNDKLFSQLGHMFSQIGWRNFTKGSISNHFYEIQKFHSTMTRVTSIGQIGPSNSLTKFSKLRTCNGYTVTSQSTTKGKDTFVTSNWRTSFKKLTSSPTLAPRTFPRAAGLYWRLTFTEITSFHIKTQTYWTLAVQAALTAKQLEDKQGKRLMRIRTRLNTKTTSRKKVRIAAIKQKSELTACIDPPKPLTTPTRSNRNKQCSHHSLQSAHSPQQCSMHSNQTSNSINWASSST
jgi:hypothetical protein